MTSNKIKTIEWYFDFISPFAYLQLTQLKSLNESNIVLHFRPILFAGLLEYWQNVGPAEVPPKRIFTYRYCQWLARKMNIPLKIPPAHPFNSLAALRLAIAMNNDPKIVTMIFETIWRNGMDIAAKNTWQTLSHQLQRDDLVEIISQPNVKQQLRDNTEQAAAYNIFGVPTIRIDGENFWGVDAFEMACDYLREPEWFDCDEMKRLLVLPEAIQRKR